MRNIKLLLLSSAIFALPVLLYLQGEKLTIKEKQVNQIQGAKEVDSLKIVVEYHKKLEAFLQKEILKPIPGPGNISATPVVIHTQPVVVYPATAPPTSSGIISQSTSTGKTDKPIISREDSLRAILDSEKKAKRDSIAAVKRDSITTARATEQYNNDKRQRDLSFLQGQIRAIDENIKFTRSNRRLNKNYPTELDSLFLIRKELTKRISLLK